MAKTPSKLSISLIGVVIGGIAIIVVSHVMMGNLDNVAKKEEQNTQKKEKVELITSDDTIETITMRVGDEVFPVLVDNSGIAQEFAKATPAEYDMVELNGNEKYYKGHDTFDATDAQDVTGTIKAGDLLLYEDNTIVLFYKGFKTTYSYKRIGWVQNAYNLERALGDGDVSVIFTKQ